VVLLICYAISTTVLVRNVKYLAGPDQVRVRADGGLVGEVNFRDAVAAHVAVKLLGNGAQAVASLDGVAGRAGFQIGANVH
jgi:hypothetical protein